MMRKYATHEKQRFSIRKYASGAASVLIATACLFATGQVEADEVIATNSIEPQASAQGLVTEETSQEVVESQTESDASQAEEGREETSASKVDTVNDARGRSASDSEQDGQREELVADSTDQQPSDSVTQTSDNTDESIEVADDQAKEAAIQEEKRQAGQAPAVAETRATRSVSDVPAVSGQLVIENQTNDGFDVFVRDLQDTNGILAVKLPVWTAKSGQDDLVWYDAARQNNGDYKVTVTKSRHKNESGRYYVHLYYVEPGDKLVGVATTETTLAGQTDNRKQLEKSGYYTFEEEVEVKNQALIAAPTEFHFNAGEKIYYDRVLETDGYQWISYVSYSRTRRYIPLAPLPQAVAQPQSDSQRTGSLAFSDQENGNFRVVVTNVSDNKGIRQVKVPVWTAVDGQDDVIWYDAVRQNDGSYTVDVQRDKHKGVYGLYHAHLYYVEGDGRLVGVATAVHTTKAPQGVQSGQLAISKQTSSGFTVTVSHIQAPYAISEVLVPVWSASGGQDDITWYRASRQNDGNYQVTVNVANHTYSSGVYHVHLYYKADNGQVYGVAGTQVNLGQVNQPTTSLPSSGRYTLNKRVEVRNQGNLSAPVVFSLNAGDSILYDRQFVAEGRQWLSYVSYSGTRRYLAL
ncbi:GBS Bsp-like repeat-containing protein [Streptococcus sp. DD12]|uniref:GBS Bsp-like repeat-containing protein n=1 Tax=Streptococcus sp. DD12 TaxID=1777880 RepID=UPI0007949F89|nr:GBS Bsp-like repeat-containing protein [Streptococcus sp. DD12]KXT76773.1 hypothetical protein STRDD12_00178 [Streptococcus sp. DD12]